MPDISENFNSATTDENLRALVHVLKIKNFRGIFSRDNIPKTLKRGAYIVNYDTESGGGTHWISVVMSSPTRGFYYSSMGDKPLSAFCRKGLNIEYNDIQDQAFNSNLCGLFSVAFILMMQEGMPAREFCSRMFKHQTEKGRLANNKLVIRILNMGMHRR